MPACSARLRWAGGRSSGPFVDGARVRADALTALADGAGEAADAAHERAALLIARRLDLEQG